MRAYVVTGRLEREFEVVVQADSDEEAMDMVEGGEVEFEFFAEPSVLVESVEEVEDGVDVGDA